MGIQLPRPSGSWTNSDSGYLRAAEGKLWNYLDVQGKSLVERVATDEAFTLRVGDCMLLDGFCEPPDHVRARSVFGNNFFGLPEWKRYCGLSITPDLWGDIPMFSWRSRQWSGDINCPFYADQEIGDTHFCFLGMKEWVDGEDLTALKWQEILKANDQHPKFADYTLKSDADRKEWAPQAYLAMHWYVLPKDPVPTSFRRTWDQQKAMLPEGYETAYLWEVVNMMVLRGLLEGGKPAYSEPVAGRFPVGRCQEEFGDENSQATVKYEEDGIVIGGVSDDERDDNLCIWASLRPPDDVMCEYEL